MRAIAFSAALASIVVWSPLARADAPSAPPAPVDYNAPDPNRNALNFARALANVTFSNYVVYQINWFSGANSAYVSRSSIAQVLKSDLDFDYDPLGVNLLQHPLQGSLDFNAGRAAGLSFWESALFAPIGALEWDYFAEVQLNMDGGWRSKPSTNDFLTTATAGILLGEGAYRIASELLDDSTSGTERALREIAAGLIDPMRAVNRIYTGQAWRYGPPPLRSHPMYVALDLGIDYLVQDHHSYTPTALIAAEFIYGDLLPTKANHTLDPLEFFEGYSALTLGQQKLTGGQMYTQGLLFGYSSPLTADDQTEQRDNNVFGFIQNFDYEGSNLLTYGSLSLGPADYLEWRFGPRRKARIGFDVDWTYLAATTSPFAGPFTLYNFSMGGAAGFNGRLELGPYGNLSWRSRNYLTDALDGQGHSEFVGYGRVAYDIDIFPHVGLGASPTVIYRRSMSDGQHFGQTALETQVYLHIDN